MKSLPSRRYTDSRAKYWQGMFNDFAAQEADHAVSGWSVAGLARRKEAYAATLPALEVPPDGLALDLGCGAGVYVRHLLDRGLKAVGVDYAWKVAAKAKGRCQGGMFAAASAYSLPFGAGAFDHVVCIGLFQSLDDHGAALGEINRVLKPGGSLCLMTLNSRQALVRLQRALGREDALVVDGEQAPRLKTYDPGLLAKEAAQVGFQVLRTRPVQIYPDFLLPARAVVDAWNRVPALGFLTARSLMLTARKV